MRRSHPDSVALFVNNIFIIIIIIIVIVIFDKLMCFCSKVDVFLSHQAAATSSTGTQCLLTVSSVRWSCQTSRPHLTYMTTTSPEDHHHYDPQPPPPPADGRTAFFPYREEVLIRGWTFWTSFLPSDFLQTEHGSGFLLDPDFSFDPLARHNNVFIFPSKRKSSVGHRAHGWVRSLKMVLY